MSGLKDLMKEKAWSPYWAGAGLGLVSTLALWISDQLLGASGAFENLAGGVLKSAGSSLSQFIYFKFIMPPGITWQVILLIGVVLGSLVSSLWSRDFRFETVPSLWVETFGPSRVKRWIAMFIGGIILEYGAGIAGGCTSGLAISGSLQLAPAGFLFIAGLFASGIVTAKLLYGRKY